ncbi:MAG TPA: glucose-1-phosphate adenylyltransferase [Candidatus Omnitrophica bacterium]|nr:glucose-1-phosphate adenylyltransferase [Candidatus Omnitrophota bacterium]
MKRKFNGSILALVLAGGRGERLYPLTLERTKPSVPFGGKYRIIDFALSNLINSGIYSIYVLVQYKSQSLIEHIRTTWIKEGLIPKHFITVVPPQMRREDLKEWYRGTADSVYQNINLIYDFKPRLVAIFGGDHTYRMNIRDMVEYHLEKKAQITISVTPVEAKVAYQFGIVEVDKNFKIKVFKEKPFFTSSKVVFASMGNYIFNTDLLVEILEEDAKRDTSHDFGKDIIPQLVKKRARIFAYDFSKNRIPSLKEYEAMYYWQDVGTISSYWKANMDLLGERPKIDLNNPSWPIYASHLNCSPAYTINSRIENSLICEGAKIFSSRIKNSIIGRGVEIFNSLIEDSIVMDFTRIEESCKVRKTIIDRFNFISKKTKIGYKKESDKRDYYLDSSGIVVVKRGSRILQNNF